MGGLKMAIKSGFFNSLNGDRKYNAEDMSEYFDGLITDGVFESIGNKLQVTATGSDMTININSGRAMIDCHWLKNDSAYNITLSPADVQLSRYDSIGIKLDYNERAITFIVHEGNLGTAPVISRPSNTESIKYLWLADIRVSSGVSSVRQGNIIDRRGTSICPWVTGLIKQVDTSQLFSQWQHACQSFYNELNAYFDDKKAEYENWFSTLTETLTVDTYIQKYQNSYEVTKETMELSIGIPEYDNTKDILFANINGVEFIEGVDYQISGDKIVLFNSIKGDNQITFIVLKSKIGSST
jgi:hypothetical protein